MIDKEFFIDSRPWKVESGSIYTADGTPIAHMDRVAGNGTSPTERDQNAHLIVEAVNAYDIDDARQTERTRNTLCKRKDQIIFALADIRNTMRDQNHSGTAYEQEKLDERDRLLTEWHAIHRQLDRMPPRP